MGPWACVHRRRGSAARQVRQNAPSLGEASLLCRFPRHRVRTWLLWALGTAPPSKRVRAHTGNQRLRDRWSGYTRRHKKHTVAKVAIAREPAGWCWSPAVIPD
jgi:transposase